MKRNWTRIITALAAALLVPFAAQADVIGYNFSHGGFGILNIQTGELEEIDEEVVVSGMFFGSDDNEDGVLSDFELTGFMMQILEDGEVDFTFDSSEADDFEFFLTYFLDGNGKIDEEDEGIGLAAYLDDDEEELLLYLAFGGDDGLLPCETLGICGLIGIGEDIFDPDGFYYATKEFAQVTPNSVAEPASLVLLGLGMLAFAFARRRREL